MNTPSKENSLEEQVDRLELSVGKLLKLCNQLSVENSAFEKSNQELLLDRSDLNDKNEKARVQVEAMINRLKAIDSTS